MHVSGGSRGGRGRGSRAGFPVGTKLFFPQATVPVGWTLDVTHNDKAIRIVNTSGGGSGGTNSFSATFASINTGSSALSTAQLAAHTHLYQTGPFIDSSGYTAANSGKANDPRTFGGDNITQTIGSGSTHNHTVDNRVQYVDTVIGRKA